MISLLRWIWGGIKALGKRLLQLLGVLWELMQHAITWVLAGFAYLAHLITQWVCDGIESGLRQISIATTQAESLSNIPALAQYVLVEWLNIEVAIQCLLFFLTIWIACKLARLAMIPIRAVLDVL